MISSGVFPSLVNILEALHVLVSQSRSHLKSTEIIEKNVLAILSLECLSNVYIIQLSIQFSIIE